MGMGGQGSKRALLPPPPPPLPAWLQDEHVKDDANTPDAEALMPTAAAVDLVIENSRWEGVPIKLVCAKARALRISEAK